MKKYILPFIVALSIPLLASASIFDSIQSFFSSPSLGAPTTTIVPDLIITGVKSASCLKTTATGLVTSTSCGASSSFTTSTLAGITNTIWNLLSGSGISITTSSNNITIANTGVLTESDPIWNAASSSYYLASNPSNYITDGNTNWDNTYGFVTSSIVDGYLSTTTGNWIGTWQGVSSSTFYLASNPSGYISAYTETDPKWAASSSNYFTKGEASSTFYPLNSNPAGYITSFTASPTTTINAAQGPTFSFTSSSKISVTNTGIDFVWDLIETYLTKTYADTLYLSSSTQYIATTTGDWLGSWQSKNPSDFLSSSTVYVASESDPIFIAASGTLPYLKTTTTIFAVATATGPAFIFSTSSDTNVGLQVSCSGGTCSFTPTWIGTLADGRIASAATWNAKQDTISFPLPLASTTGAIALTNLSSTATGLTYTNTTGVFSLTGGYEIPTTASTTNWMTAYADRLKWDGGATGLVAATGRTSLGLGTFATADSVDYASTTNIQKVISFPLPVASTSLAVTTPLVLTTNQLSMPTSTGSVNGYLSSVDWTTFNNKQSTISFPLAVASTSLTGGAGLTLTTNDMACDTANASTFGCLSAANWVTFNAKITTTSLSVAYPPLAYNGTTGVFSLPTSTASQSGFLSSANWTTFNAKITTTSLSATSPIVYNNTTGAFALNITAVSSTHTGTVDFGGATSFEIPNGTNPAVDTAGEIGLDTTAQDFLVASGTTAVVYGRNIQKIVGVTIASSSAWYASSSLLQAPSDPSGFTGAWIYCYTDTATATIGLSDGTNHTNQLTCGVGTNATKGALTTNNTWTAGEKFYIRPGAYTGTPNQVTIGVWGTYTRQ